MTIPLRYLLFVLLSAISALGVAGPAGAADSPALTTIRVAGSPNDDMATLVYAEKSGMFEKAGLHVVIAKTNSGAAAASGVAGGAFDIGKGSITSIFDAHEHGVPFTIAVAAGIYSSKEPYGGILLAKNLGLKTGKDAEGKTFSVASLSSIGRVAMGAWITAKGGNVAAVKFVELPFSAVGPAIEQNRIVGGEVGPPVQNEDLDSGRFGFLPAYDEIAPTFYVSVFFTTTQFSTAHPEALRTFARVLYDAARFLNAHHDATVGMMSQFTGVPLEVIKKMPRVTFATELQAAQIQPSIDASVKYGTLRHGFAAHELIDPNVPSH